MNLWQRTLKFFGRLFGVLLAAVSVRIDDSPGWNSGGRPVEQPWAERYEGLTDSLEAWRKSFLIRQYVRLTTAYVVGDGIRVFSKNPDVEKFIREFWDHPENKLDDRLAGLCDELTRAGELFPVLFTNRGKFAEDTETIAGMSQIRFVPAIQIEGIKVDSEDYEKELGYWEQLPNQIERKCWKSKRTAKVPGQAIGKDGVDRSHRPDPMMLHYTINKPVGDNRGESDLSPILPWARRYSAWLKDRVRFNKLRTELAAVDIEIEDENQVEAMQQKYKANPPTAGAINVHGTGQKVSFPAANIQAYDAEPDGKAIRLAFAAGGNIPLHFLAEGSSATRSTAAEMGDPTHRHYRMRQKGFVGILKDIVEQAWRRYEQVNEQEPLGDLQIDALAPDVSRADNKALADAAKTIVAAFAQMKVEGWITDEIAVRLSFKFAGETLDEKDIMEILQSGGEQNDEKEEDTEIEEEGEEDAEDE